MNRTNASPLVACYRKKRASDGCPGSQEKILDRLVVYEI